MHSQQESQIALHGNCCLKLKQRWRSLWIKVNTFKTETSYLISALALLKTCCNTRNAMEHFLRQRFLFYKVFSILKSNVQQLEIRFNSSNWVLAEEIHLLFVLLEAKCSLSRDFSPYILREEVLLCGKVIEAWKPIFTQLEHLCSVSLIC